MFLLSVIIVAASAFILPQTQYGFGWPLQWIEYHGQSSIDYISEGLQFKNVTHLSFDLWNLLVGSLIIYGVLLVMYKGLNRINRKTETGENQDD